VSIDFMVLAFLANAQMFTIKITRELKFEKVSASNTLILANINGSVKVQDTMAIKS